jgi:hypothetical protein
VRRIRFNIASLLVVVLLVAVGFAAQRESNEFWDCGLFTLTLIVLLISILLAIHRSDARRAFWLGFTLFGWIYLGLSLVPPIETRLMTTKALAYLESKMPGRLAAVYTMSLSRTGSGSPSDQTQSAAFTASGNKLVISRGGQWKLWDATTGRLLAGWGGTTENFVKIGHSLFALLAGWFGGLLSRRLWRASIPSEPETVGLP